MLPRTVSPSIQLAGGGGGAGREGNVSLAAAAARRRLCCPAGAPTMEAADHGRGDDAAAVGTLHRAGLRGVLLQCEVGPDTVVVGKVVAQQTTQVGLVEHDHMVEALAAQGPDET